MDFIATKEQEQAGGCRMAAILSSGLQRKLFNLFMKHKPNLPGALSYVSEKKEPPCSAASWERPRSAPN